MGLEGTDLFKFELDSLLIEDAYKTKDKSSDPEKLNKLLELMEKKKKWLKE